MKTNDVIRAWTDRDFRNDLSKDDQASLPEHPTGIAQVDDEALTGIAGGCVLTTIATSCVPPGYHCP